MMRQQHVLEFKETYPFGKAILQSEEDQIIVVKKVSFRNPAQRTRLLNKAEFLKNLSSNLNIVGFLGYEESLDSFNLIYQYIPFNFFTLLQKNCDQELSQARCTLSKLTIQLKTLGLKTNIHQETVGLDARRRLKYYVSIDDIPDTHFEHTSEELNFSRNQQGVLGQSEANNIIPLAQGVMGSHSQGSEPGKQNLLPLPQADQALPRLSGLSHQSQSLKRTTVSHQKMDDLLSKINERLQELSKYRRKTTPSRCNSKYLPLPQNEYFGETSNCTQFKTDSCASTQIENPKQLRVEKTREKLALSPQPKTLVEMVGSRLKYSSSSENLLGEYEALKTERKQVIKRLKAVVEKTDGMLEGYRNRKMSTGEALINI